MAETVAVDASSICKSVCVFGLQQLVGPVVLCFVLAHFLLVHVFVLGPLLYVSLVLVCNKSCTLTKIKEVIW